MSIQQRTLTILGLTSAAALLFVLANGGVDRGLLGLSRSEPESNEFAAAVVLQASQATDGRQALGDETAGAAEPWATTERAHEHLADLAAAMVSRDADLSGDLVRAFFQGGAASLDRLLEITALETVTESETYALGVLFKSASYYLMYEPELLDPWTPSAFASMGIELLGSGDHIPMVLACGFDELGPHLQPELLTQLIDRIESELVGPPMSQVQGLALIDKWARTMGPEVEAALADSLRSEETSDGSRAQAASMLIHRDWRRLGPDIVELRSEQREGADAEAWNNSRFTGTIGVNIKNVSPLDQGEYFQLFSEEEGLAVAMAWHLEGDSAGLALSQPSSQRLTPFARDLLEFRSGMEDPVAVGSRLLADDAIVKDTPALERLVLQTWLGSDLVFDERVTGYLEQRFDKRKSDPDRFWGTLSSQVSSLEDYQVMEAVLPLLENSRGERDTARTNLVALVEARFNGLDLE